MDKRREAFHPVSWTVWLIGALVPALVTRNPFYLTLMLMAASLVYIAVGRSSPLYSSWHILLKTGLILAAFGAILNPLTVHIGEHVLFTLPSLQLKAGGTVFLEIGGKMTLEALSYGLVNGLSLALILLIFAAFNLGADHYRLLRAIPFHQTGVVMSIAFTFVPQMVASLRRIREAQTIRGHRFRSLRDIIPLVIPLLVSALEKAIQLAESMEARGFSYAGSASEERFGMAQQAMLGMAFFAILGGLAGRALFPGKGQWMGTAAMALGLGVLLLSLRRMAKGRKRSHYRRDQWRREDILITAISGVVLAGFGMAWALRESTLWFYPYPSFHLPGVNPWLAVLSALTATPAIIRGS